MVLSLCAVAMGACGPDAKPLPAPPEPMKITMREYRFDVVPPAHAGRVVITLENAGTVEHQLAFVRLGDDVPPLDQQLRGGDRRAARNIVVMLRPPGATRTFALDLAPGRYGMLCFVRAPDGEVHALKGMNAELRIG